MARTGSSLPQVSGARGVARRRTRSLVGRIGVILLVASLAGPAAVPTLAATTLPALWTAGGLDAGNGGAGQAARIASDAEGNIAIVSGPSLARDLAVTSYTAGGSFRWRSSVGPASGTFIGDWVAAAPGGEFVAVGRNTNANGQPITVTLVRFAADGALRWRVDLARTLPSVGRLLVDGAGNAYLAFNSLGDGQDIQLHKYNNAGVLQWARGIATGPMANDIATSLALSADGAEIALTGDIIGGATWITALYDTATGTRKWLVTAAEGIAALDVVVDATRVYVTGQGNVGITGFLTVVAYDRSTGARLWRTDRKPADGAGAAGLRMAMAPDGSLAVTGQASRGFLDWYTVVLETTGAVRWEAVRDGGLNTDEIPRGVLVMNDGTVVVTGPGGPNLPGGYIGGVTAGYGAGGSLLWEAFSRQATVWATALPGGDVCAAGGYDALVTCWHVAGVAGNLAPIAVATATPTSGTAPLAVSFTGSGSSDPDGTIASWSWSFGDGGTSTLANPAHTYTAAGTYRAALTVTDNGGASAGSAVTIVVSATGSTVMRSTAISLSATLQRKVVSVTGDVVVRNGDGVAVSGAVVSATWTRPGGFTVAQTATTGAAGTARFGTTGARGTYTLTVTGIGKAGFTFDAAGSILARSITR